MTKNRRRRRTRKNADDAVREGAAIEEDMAGENREGFRSVGADEGWKTPKKPLKPREYHPPKGIPVTNRYGPLSGLKEEEPQLPRPEPIADPIPQPAPEPIPDPAPQPPPDRIPDPVPQPAKMKKNKNKNKKNKNANKKADPIPQPASLWTRLALIVPLLAVLLLVISFFYF